MHPKFNSCFATPGIVDSKGYISNIHRDLGGAAVPQVPVPPEPAAGVQPRAGRPRTRPQPLPRRGECDHRGVRRGRHRRLGARNSR